MERRAAPRPLSRGRRAAYLAVTLLTPVIAVAGIEVALRLFRPAGGLPAVVTAPFGDGAYRVVNGRVARRWFGRERNPPGPPMEPFASSKPPRSLRVFVLGESSTAGFPYPRNVTFSRVLRDVLRDVLPGDSAEVINVGIAATNSFALADIATELISERPDAVLIYAGHNEYYGALGVGSTEAIAASPALVRGYLRLARLRTVQVLRAAVGRARRGTSSRSADSAASLMELLARDRQIVFGSDEYQRGVTQLESNLRDVAARCRSAGISLFIASLASNVRDQPPFVAPRNLVPGGAVAVYDSARALLARGVPGDSTLARSLFERARDLDVVRFRAPTEFNAVIRRVASEEGATYVPVAEAFAAAAPDGIPGRELFLEHVHPNRGGYLLIARTFFEALRGARFLGRDARVERLRPWAEYEREMALTRFDERIAEHTVRTIAGRWPFVASEQQTDYRGTYRATGVMDSLALLVSRGGMSWAAAKLRLATVYERSGFPDSAAAEYRGLARDAPFAEPPLRLLARALLQATREAEAESTLRRAMNIQPTAFSAYTLGLLAARRRQFAEAIPLLELAVRLEPTNAASLYQLSLAYGLSRDLRRARDVALRLRQVAPRYPGLDGWLRALGLAG